MNSKPKQIITIDSQQSDIESSFSNQPMEIQEEYNNISIRSLLQQDMYEKFNNSKYYLLTESLRKYADQISNFLESRKNVLFIFGPSGCGKSILVRKILEHNSIYYDKLEECEDEEGRMVPLKDIILHSLTKMNSQHPYICYDFPITIEKWNMHQIREFKAKFLQEIKKTITKTIFILNENIYNSFYVLNERASSEENLNTRENVSVIKFEKFGVMQMKKILKGFYEHQKLYNHVGLGKDFLQQIVELSNGDLRKALNMLYWRGVEDKAEKILREQRKKVEAFETEKKRNQTKDKGKTSSKSHQMQILLEQDEDSFCQNNSHPLSRTSSLSEIQMFTNTMTVKRPKSRPKNVKPPNYAQFMKYKPADQSRCSLYHGLGKLLYGKRLNIRHHPKNKKDVSCYYTEKQIDELDPPFYFDPVSLVDHLRIDFDIVSKLLQENYLERYGKIKDVMKMSQIFCMDDGFFSYLNVAQDEEVKEIKVKLIVWGILIYNKNSRTDNMGFRKIEKSQITNIDRKVKQKKRLIKQYFPESRLADLLKFAHFTRNTNSLLNETLFNKSIARQIRSNLDDHTKTFNEEEEQQLETMIKMNANDIQNKLKENRILNDRKKKEMEALFAELEEEDENIDEIENSD